jgi:hypothetical protein
MLGRPARRHRQAGLRASRPAAQSHAGEAVRRQALNVTTVGELGCNKFCPARGPLVLLEESGK